MIFNPEIHGAQGFTVLMRQLREQIQISQAGELAPDFNSFDNCSPVRQKQMIDFAYILHMRIQYALGAKQIHRALDAKIVRMQVGRELNEESINGPKQQGSGHHPNPDSAQ